MIASVERLFTAPVQRDPLGVHSKAAEASGNEPDLRQVLASLNDVLAMQRKIRLELIELNIELKKNIRAMCVELGDRLDSLAGQVASLRDELASCHAAVVVDGMPISGLDAGPSRIEEHPDLPAPVQSG
jgi:hypothetical protein